MIRDVLYDMLNGNLNSAFFLTIIIYKQDTKTFASEARFKASSSTIRKVKCVATVNEFQVILNHPSYSLQHETTGLCTKLARQNDFLIKLNKIIYNVDMTKYIYI